MIILGVSGESTLMEVQAQDVQDEAGNVLNVQDAAATEVVIGEDQTEVVVGRESAQPMEMMVGEGAENTVVVGNLHQTGLRRLPKRRSTTKRKTSMS